MPFKSKEKLFMDYLAKTEKPEKIRSDCLIIPVFEDKKLSAFGKQIDQHCQGAIKALLKSGDMTGKANHTVTLFQPAGVQCERILLLGCGKADEVTAKTLQKLIGSAWQVVENMPVTTTHWDVLSIAEDLSEQQTLRFSIAAIEQSLYEYLATKSDATAKIVCCKKVVFLSPNAKRIQPMKTAIAQSQAIAAGVNLAKELSDLPGNVCTPTYLASEASKLAKTDKNFQVKVLSEADMTKLGMGALMSVSKGSREPAKLIIMSYQGGAKSDAPIVLVGKGLTFDAGGISIKPSAAMDEMKYDMCGGASVFGTLLACKNMQLPMNIVGVVPSSENLPDGAANKPGDVVTSLSGQTIEVLNTDAEGRLILCDTLTYVERLKPKLVIDIATLTGACIVALGSQASGLLANDQALADALIEAGQETNDRCWQLPLWEDYQEQLKSNFADMANIGGKGAGTITAACFLSRFAKKFTWAHLDIAGTAWQSGSKKGATGRPVELLTQFILNQQ